MAYENIIVEELANGVVLIRLNRLKKYNTLSKDLTDELYKELSRLDANQDKYGCVVLTGTEKVFCAGADISELKRASADTSAVTAWSQSLPKIKIPVIAAVHGFCLGGGIELAMICDIMYATRDAVFGQPEIKIGVIPGGGGTQRLPKAIGKARAMEIILTGDTFSAEEAEQWGLVARLYDSNEELLEAAIETAGKISKGPRQAIVAAKQAVLNSYSTGLDEGAANEVNIFVSLLNSHDKEEGMSAFFEKRRPTWKWRKAKL